MRTIAAIILLITLASPGPACQACVGRATAQPAVVATAVQDLAQRAGVEPAAVRVVTWEAVDWPSSALGAENPGMGYLTVITPGYRLVLAAGGQHHIYHTDQGTRAIHVRSVAPPVGP